MKTRFAPSPTGLMHLGNCRTALFNYLFAAQQHGAFLLRVEDTDNERSDEQYALQIMHDLQWLALYWQEGPGQEGESGPYLQSQRNEIYEKYYQLLQEKGLIYPCFCSDAQLKIARKLQIAAGEPPRYPGTCTNLSKDEVKAKLSQGLIPTLRFKMPRNETVAFNDLVRGQQSFKTNDLGDFIIRKTDQTPTFMFCNAIDDALMNVTHVVRGEDHLTNTPRQLLILQALGLPTPIYGHISIILGQDGKPLSKRNGSRSVKELHDKGYLPIAIVNYLARLGHAYEDNSLLSLPELAEKFITDRLVKAPAKYDESQLMYWQKEAVLSASNEELWYWIQPIVNNKISDKLKDQFLNTIKANVITLDDVVYWIDIFFTESLNLDSQVISVLLQTKEGFFASAIAEVEQNEIDWKQFTNGLKEKTGISGKQLFQPLRIALTGQLHGPEMAPIFALLGKDNIIQRFNHAISSINNARD